MPRYSGDGRAIIKQVQADLHKLGTEMSLLAEWDHLPAGHRARLRSEKTAAARAVRGEGRAALAAWAREEEADARRRLHDNSVGTPAEEARRVSNELRIGRLVESSRASSSQRSDAADLAARGNRAYELGNLDEAEVLARASAELMPNRQADEVWALVTYDRIAADPAKARASRDLDDVGVVTAAFHRDVSAAYSAALRESATLAKAVGESGSDVAADAAAAALDSKMVAFVDSQRRGVPYAEPADLDGRTGVGITGEGTSTSVPQPLGAHLSGLTVSDPA